MLKHEIKESAGLLSPSGLFYPCEFGNHDKLSDQIVSYLGLDIDNVGNAQAYLENTGWIHVAKTGCALYFNNKPTQCQLDSLMDIYNIAFDEKYKTNIMNFINSHVN